MSEDKYRKAVINRLTVFLVVMGIFTMMLVGHNIMMFPELNKLNSKIDNVDKKITEIKQNLDDLIPNN